MHIDTDRAFHAYLVFILCIFQCIFAEFADAYLSTTENYLVLHSALERKYCVNVHTNTKGAQKYEGY